MHAAQFQEALDYLYSFIDYGRERTYRYSPEVFDLGRVVADGPAREVLTAESLDQLGVRRTRYTLAAQAAFGRRMIRRAGILPATLEQAAEYFR